MPNISEMANPVALTGLELVPGLQGDDDVGVPLLALGDALPRGAVLLLRKPFLADTASTTAGDPGAGNVRWNHATQASATEIYIDDADAAAGDVSGVWATLQVGGFLYLQGVVGAARAKYQKWEVSAKVDEAGYGKLTVTLVSSAGSFADDEAVELTLQQPDPSESAAVKITASIAGGTITPDGDTDLVRPSSTLSSALTIANPATTIIDGWGMVIEIKDDGTARALTWGSKYANRIGALPANTVAGKQHVIGVSYNAANDKMYCDFALVQA